MPFANLYNLKPCRLV